MHSPFRQAAMTFAAGAAFAAAAFLAVPGTAAAQNTVVSFENLPHGAKLGSGFGFSASNQVDIRAANDDVNAPDVAAIFDTNRRNTSDPDLEAPFPTGNLAGIRPGNIIILPENNIDRNSDGILDDPDDLGNRPSGQFRLTFTSQRMTSFGFDLFDIENVEASRARFAYLVFQRRTGTNTFSELARIPFVNFITPGNKYYDPTIRFGDHSANRIRPVTAASIGAPFFDRVLVTLDGSGALDNLNFTAVPEPTTAGLAALAAAALLVPRRRRA